MKKEDKYSGKMKSLNIEHFKYRTLLTKKFENRKAYVEHDPKLVIAFIPGTIRKINVKAGDTVKKGDLLLILEAMKMKNRLLSPMDGVIKEVKVKTGVIVPKNEVLIKLE
jgi:biotin carboxyl carrier protein